MSETQQNQQVRPSFDTLPPEVQMMVFQELGIGRKRVILTSLNPGKLNRWTFKPTVILTEYFLVFINTSMHALYNRYILYSIREHRNVVHVNIKDGDTANLQAFLQQAPLNTLDRFEVAAGTDATSNEGLTGPCFAVKLQYTLDFSYDNANDAYIKVIRAINKHVAPGHIRMLYRVMDDFERSPGLSTLLQEVYSKKPRDYVGQARFMNDALRKRFSDPERTVGQIEQMNNMLGTHDINEVRVQDNVEEEEEVEEEVTAPRDNVARQITFPPAPMMLAQIPSNTGQIGMPGRPAVHAGMPHGLPLLPPPQPPPPPITAIDFLYEDMEEDRKQGVGAILKT